MGTKRRMVMGRTGGGTSVVKTFGAVTSTTQYRHVLRSFQEVFSVGHQWPASGKYAKKLDTGGAFLSQKVENFAPLQNFNIQSGSSPTSSRWETYNGPLLVTGFIPPADASLFLQPSSANVLDVLGTQAINSSLPTNPLAGMGQFLGELREGIPRIPDPFDLKNNSYQFLHSSRHLGGEFLNVEFGWKPFIKDLKDLMKTVRHQAAEIEKFDRNSGRHIRRRRSILEDSSAATFNDGNSFGFPSIGSLATSSAGQITRTVITTRKAWFSGAFTYYLPPAGGPGKWARYAQLANKLYGLRVTPELLWELAPWSWLIDWKVDLGSIIGNWSAFANDGLVMHYGYVCETKVETTTWQLQNLRHNGVSYNVEQFRVKTTKVRRKATPYGFGLNPSSFSTKQWGIIGALGISRVPKGLT
jgi:hypothetical protein